MSRVVFLHIGAPKTGTTYLQDRLTLNARSLARHGVHFPSRSPLVSPALFQFRAALDLLGQDWGGPPGHAQGSWPALVRRVRRTQETVIVSHEILAPARPEHVDRVMTDFSDREVHIVYSARDLSRALPAAYQESIKQGRTWSYRQFLRRARRGTPWFYRAFDISSVLGTWGAQVPPERVHVVTVPPRTTPAGTGEDPLFLRFCEAFRIDPAWAPVDSNRANKSLGTAETQLLRQLNGALSRDVRREAPYDPVVRRLANDVLVGRESAGLTLPPRAFTWVSDVTERWLDDIVTRGYDVVGDLSDLVPSPPGARPAWRSPDSVPAEERLEVSLEALAALTRELASRPDPRSQPARRAWRRARRAMAR